MPVGKTNYNSTATATANKQVAPANASRTTFTFKSLGAVFVLNFGDTATADNILTVGANESITLISNRCPYEIRSQINVYCATASNFQAQAEEFSV